MFDTKQKPGLSRVEVSEDALRYNLAALRGRLGAAVKIMAVVKSDAYGHGLIPVSRTLEAAGADAFAVVLAHEALALRRAGVTSPVLMLAGPDGLDAATAADASIDIGICCEQDMLWAEAADAQGTQLAVHVKFDTGMQRRGFVVQAVDAVIDRLRRLKQLRVAGVYSHLANAEDLSDDWVHTQRALFAQVAYRVEEAVGRPLIKHLANSAGVFRTKELHFDMVRPGIALYGYHKVAAVKLLPAMRWVSEVVQMKNLQPGDTVGYDRAFRAQRASRIGVVPVGYADGFSRAYSGVLVELAGKRVPVVGRVCMDMLMIDMTDVDTAGVGAPVVLLGGEDDEGAPTAFDLARLSGTTHYEVLTSLHPRVDRTYPTGKGD